MSIEKKKKKTKHTVMKLTKAAKFLYLKIFFFQSDYMKNKTKPNFFS